ncbi:hypothetical protein BT63DRAFT_437704 [Microthyrium microscopicum]|uniref:Uncharacterized protein n=1 Tax=Microthyrium microscopicum TaxID=703497 RepID=A0A6A6UHU1_9PEZI|nr:hypothetical protein BT63DRAFT_437704 [Microthyrium microscopicum]
MLILTSSLLCSLVFKSRSILHSSSFFSIDNPRSMDPAHPIIVSSGLPSSSVFSSSPPFAAQNQIAQQAPLSSDGVDRRTASGPSAFGDSTSSHHASDDDTDDEDLSARLFAQKYGLTRDYLSCPPLDDLAENKVFWAVGEESTADEELGWAIRRFFDVKDGDECWMKEMLGVDRGAMRMLQDVIVQPGEFPVFEMGPADHKMVARRKEEERRLEVPLLSTDDELDLLRFSRLQKPFLENMALPFAPVDVELDEGMEWPESWQTLPEEKMAEISGEKLKVYKEGMMFLMETQQDGWVEKDGYKMMNPVVTYKRSTRVRSITPPMMPLEEDDWGANLSSPKLNLQPFSETTDPDVKQLEDVNQKILEEDAMFDSQDLHVDISKIYTPMQSILESSSPKFVPVKISDFRLDVPVPAAELTSPSSRVKSESVQNVLESISHHTAQWDGRTSDNMPDGEEVMKPLADAANQKLTHEVLNEADSTLRLEVPVLDFTAPTPPWLSLFAAGKTERLPLSNGLHAQRGLLRQSSKELVKLYSTWPGASKIERQLKWRPFPDRLGKVAINEKIDQLAFLGPILEYMTLEDVVSSDSLIVTSNSLQVLSELDDEEDDLELGDFSHDEQNVDFVVRKRKADMMGGLQLQGRQKVSKTSTAIPISQTEVESLTLQRFDRKQPNHDTISHSKFSATDGLHKFFALRGIEVPKPADIEDTRRITHSTVNIPDQHSQPVRTSTTFTLPQLRPDQPARTFIISTNLLRTQRPLYRLIANALPVATFIERDFTALNHSPPNLSLPTSKATRISYDPTAEADILLSPSTALLITTLSQTTQLSLPGNRPQLNSFRTRLAQAAIRSERLVVLVSQNAAVSTPLSASQSTHFAALQGVVARLGGDVHVQLVPGGPTELAGMAAWIMESHGVDGPVAAEESGWEQILRRAGLNAYAAGAVLTALKRPDAETEADVAMVGESLFGETGDVVAPFGLPAFIKMSASERVKMFEGMMGGRRVLARVSKCLDGEWISESTGYRGSRG